MIAAVFHFIYNAIIRVKHARILQITANHAHMEEVCKINAKCNFYKKKVYFL